MTTLETSQSATKEQTQVNSTLTTDDVPAATKPRSSRQRKPVKRRGAKQHDDEEDESELAMSRAPLVDSDSDFDPELDDQHDRDDEDEDEEEDEQVDGREQESDSDVEGTTDPVTPLTTSAERLNGPAPPQRGKPAPALLTTAIAHPSWSDMPTPGETDADELPSLDFETLTPGRLASLPSVKQSSKSTKPLATTQAAAPADAAVDKDKQSKKAQIAAKRDAKMAELALLKERDPEAYEAQEKAFQEKKAQKKKEKAEKLKEKRKDKRDGERPDAPTPESPADADEFNRQQPESNQPANRAAPGPKKYQSQSREYINAKEAYSKRLADDPSYVPRVGRFWSHDDRLATPEVRPLVWRGASRGGDRGGMAGRGRGSFRGRGGFFARATGMVADSLDPSATADDKVASAENRDASEAGPTAEQKSESRPEPAAPGAAQEDSEDDGWGRGEAKKSVKPAPATSKEGAWKHDGFEKLSQEPANKSKGKARNGVRPGFESSFDEDGKPIPGAINPRYANLPFHPLHRFPVPRANFAAKVTDASPTQADATVKKIDVRIPRGQPPVQEDMAQQTANLSLEGTALAAGDAQAAEQQYTQQMQAAQRYHHLPPHLQAQVANGANPSPPSPQQGGATYYNTGMQNAYFAADAYVSMPTPGATPPPTSFSPSLGMVPPSSALFVPPKATKVEIKAPSRGALATPRSPASSKEGLPSSPQLSATSSSIAGHSAAIAQAQQQQTAAYNGMTNPYEYYGGGQGPEGEGYVSYEAPNGLVYFDGSQTPSYAPAPYDAPQMAYYAYQQQPPMYGAGYGYPPFHQQQQQQQQHHYYQHQQQPQRRAYPQQQTHSMSYQQPWVGYPQ
ncbi:hypothetical protein OIO90_000840 [Microbotryomycetes sp. JL221]|nr:hypothetical protein OIO90_000840 [Microbotryomycetes sp. JL221]